MPAVTTGTVLVFALVVAALVAFVTEVVPNDVTAIAVLVAVALLEPFTRVSATEAIRGFANPATVTIMAMYILSAGVQETGVVERLSVVLARVARDSESRLLGVTVAVTGLVAGVVNNTPVVAVFIPMVQHLASRARVSPSKLLLPLSYAAMLGGTLTVVGTSANILASDFAREAVGRPISMFEFTGLGLVLFTVGAAYLMTVGRWLVPERIAPSQDLTAEFDLENHLYQLTVRESSPLVGRRVADVLPGVERDWDLAVLQLGRDEEIFVASATDQTFEPGDVLTVRATARVTDRFAEAFRLRRLPRAAVDDRYLDRPGRDASLVEVVVPPGSRFAGDRVGDSPLGTRFDLRVLAVRRGGEPTRDDVDDWRLGVGDGLLLQGVSDTVEYLADRGDLAVTQVPRDPAGDGADLTAAPLSESAPLVLAIMGGVVAVAALGLVPIVIAALAGVVAMVAVGGLSTTEAYDAVSWNVVFLLAGVLPLGVALQQTGGADLVAAAIADAGTVAPSVVVLWLFVLVTGALAAVITPVATVVLLFPVAVDTAARIGATPYSFLLGVMFAASTAFATPVGYQTNLMVYGPGGYRFGDFVRVGAPLQVLLSVVTTLGVAVLWPL
ncbi:MAG: SLC13 family permease [Halobacteriaceae archaeon]